MSQWWGSNDDNGTVDGDGNSIFHLSTESNTSFKTPDNELCMYTRSVLLFAISNT